MRSMGSIADWIGLQGGDSDYKTLRGSLWKLLGCDSGTHPRIIANINAQDYGDLMKSLKIETDTEARPPTPTELSQAGMVGRTSRVLCKVQLSSTEELEIQKEAMVPQLGGLQQPVTEIVPAGRKIKLNVVIDQVRDEERGIMSEERVKACLRRYTDIYGAFPEPDTETTVE